MKRTRLFGAVLLLLVTPTLADSRTYDVFPNVLGGYRSRMVALEHAGGESDLKHRLRRLKKAGAHLSKAEKRLAELGPRPDPIAIILNPAFEDGDGPDPAEWSTYAADENCAWEPVGTGYDGGRCISLESSVPVYGLCWTQAVQDLIPGRYYNVTARIRGEDVVVHEDDPGKKWGGWIYRLICVKDVIGWEPFRQTYRSFPAGFGTRLEKMAKFFDELERHSRRDIRGELIPADELAWVIDHLD